MTSIKRREAERAPRESPSDRKVRKPNGGINKQFGRIISRLAMDLDEAREIRRVAVVKPVIIGEPGVAARQRDELARPRMIEAKCALRGAIENALDAGKRFHDPPHLHDQFGIRNVDMSDLMIAHREGIGLVGVEQLAVAFTAHSQQSGLDAARD